MPVLNSVRAKSRRLLVLALALPVPFAVVCWAAEPEYHAVSPAPPPGLVREVTTAEAGALRKAELVLQRECMERRGFRFPIRLEVSELDDRGYAIVIEDVMWARAHGYGSDIRRRAEELEKLDPGLRYFKRLPPQRRSVMLAAINGVPGSGDDLEARLPTGGVVRRSARSCTSEAEQRLYGDLRTWYRVKRVTGNLEGVAAERVAADASVKSAMSRWSRCVHQQGFPYSSPAQMRTAISGKAVSKGDLPAVREIEKRAAVAEARCANQTGFAATVRRLQTFHSDRLLEEYRAEFATKRRLELAAVPRACTILASSCR